MSKNDFSFRKDFKHIMWKETLWLNFLRSLFAGIVITIFMLVSGEPFNVAGVYLLFPLMYAVLLPIGIFCGILSDIGIPFAGIFTTILSIMVVLGDPLVFILHKINPNVIPVERFKFFNFQLIIFVLDDFTVTSTEVSS